MVLAPFRASTGGMTLKRPAPAGVLAPFPNPVAPFDSDDWSLLILGRLWPTVLIRTQRRSISRRSISRWQMTSITERQLTK